MPFKAGKSPEDLAKRVNEDIRYQLKLSAKALVDTAWHLKQVSDNYAPMDTGDLIQSGEVTTPVKSGSVVTVNLGYYKSYVNRLYDFSNWSPRQPGDPGKRGAFVNPNAKSKWVEHGANDIDLRRTFIEVYGK